MEKRYIVRLEDKERCFLERLVNTGQSSASKIKKANRLLKADINGQAWSDTKIANAFCSHPSSVRNLRKKFVEEGFEASLERKEYKKAPDIMDGEKEAHLIALACSHPPKGYSRWTLRLLSERFARLEIGASISHETVRRTLKKTSLGLI